jgi:Fur family transcriptional regulator, ferric uptake regulator
MNRSHDDATLHNLREQGHRLTPQRLAIMQILEEDGGHLSPTEIYERAVKRMPGLTEATVYRTLDFLVQNNLVLVAYIGDGRLAYEISTHQHHHLVCRGCNATIEIKPEMLDALFAELNKKTGFTIDQMHVTFFGLCPGCAEKKVPEKE